MQAQPQQTHVATQWKHESPLLTCRFDPTGRFLFSAAQDFKVVRWDVATGAKTEFVGHGSWPRGITFTPGGETLVTSGYDEQLIWWPAAADKPEPIRRVKAGSGWIRAVAMSPDGKLLASAGSDRVVRLWNAADGTAAMELKGHELDVHSVAFHPQGQFLLTGDLMGVICQWEVATGKLARKLSAADLHTYNDGQGVHYGGVRSIALSPDGKHLVCSGLFNASNPLGAVNDPLVVRFDWESEKVLKKHVVEGVKGIAWRATFHPSGFLIGCSGGSGGGFLVFWNNDQEKEFHKLNLPNTALELDLHPDGIQIATAHHDGHVRIARMQAKA